MNDSDYDGCLLENLYFHIKLEGNLVTTNNITFTPESYRNSENVSLVDALRELGYNDYLLALYDFDYSELDLDNDDQLYVVSKGDSELDVNIVKVNKNYNIEFSAALGFDFNVTASEVFLGRLTITNT